MDNKDYIDTVVLTEESQATTAATEDSIESNRRIPVVNDVRLTRVDGGKVSKLTIDESWDGGDPYNSTGKHCVLKRIKE